MDDQTVDDQTVDESVDISIADEVESALNLVAGTKKTRDGYVEQDNEPYSPVTVTRLSPRVMTAS